MAAHWLCPCPTPVCEGVGTRDTPDDAVDFLALCFRDRRIAEIYESFHREFREEQGGFTLEEFALAYEEFEADFAADARTLVAAERTWRDAGPGAKLVELTSSATGAFLPIEFVDRPRLRLVTTDSFAPEIEVRVDLAALVRLEDGRLGLPASFDLTEHGVPKETVAGIGPEQIVRVEIAHDWLVRRIDTERARNVRFLDKIKEHAAR